MAQGSEDRTEREIVIEHPNRAKGASRATKASVLLLLLVSAALEAVVAVGGWDVWPGCRSRSSRSSCSTW
jgi:hypothetical protein